MLDQSNANSSLARRPCSEAHPAAILAMKFMLVDDSATARASITSILVSGGAEVVEFTDGQEALAGFAAHRPDWVLMDLEMKQMDGFDATRQIKAKFPNARIVILTSFNDDFLKAAALEAGAIGYVLKNDLSSIRRLIRKGAGPAA